MVKPLRLKERRGDVRGHGGRLKDEVGAEEGEESCTGVVRYLANSS